VIDESHVTVPQIRGMFNGDRARKDTLVEHGFRLPSARDNRPLTYDEFNARVGQMIYVSATPTEFEIKDSEQVVEQVVRPTGLIDPEIVVRPIVGDKKKNTLSQVEDLLVRIHERIAAGERVLVTTLTKKTAEDLTDYLKEKKINVAYIHSDIDTLDRIEIIMNLRLGKNDVLVGVNLLREGLDIPEVSLVAVLDADKEGFLRSETTLIQVCGRAARNVEGRVVLYADVMTGSMKAALDEMTRRRSKQLAYNKEHGISPKTIVKAVQNLEEFQFKAKQKTFGQIFPGLDDNVKDRESLGRVLKELEKQMRAAADVLDFETAALIRDRIRDLKQMEVKAG
jgi:excinuclease ABC subunit B